MQPRSSDLDDKSMYVSSKFLRKSPFAASPVARPHSNHFSRSHMSDFA